MTINQDLFDRGVDHAANLRMYEEGLQRAVDRIHRNHEIRLRKALRSNNLRQTAKIRAVINREISRTVKEYRQVLLAEFKDFVSGEAVFAASTLDAAVGEHFRVRTPDRRDLKATVEKTKVVGGRTVSQNFSRIGAGEQIRVLNAISRGFSEGLTESQITDNVVRGTATKQTRQQMKTLVRTSLTRLSSKASLMTYKENADVLQGYQYVATLDQRTTQICARNDGRVFGFDDDYQPLPPLHWNCRSTTVPVTKAFNEWDPRNKRFKRLGAAREGFRASANGRVPIATDYDTWLRAQRYDVQLRHFQFDDNRWELWVKGKLPLRNFTNPAGEWISLATLRQLDVEANYRRDPTDDFVTRICYSPCINPNDKNQLAKVSVDGLDLNALLTGSDELNDLLRFIRAQHYQQLGLANIRGNTAGTRRKRQAEVHRAEIANDLDNYVYDDISGVYRHKWEAHQDFDLNLLEIERIRRNRKLSRNARVARRPGESDEAYLARNVSGDDLGLTEDQQDFLLNRLLPRLNNGAQTPDGASVLVTPNEQTVLLRSLTSIFQRHNRGDTFDSLSESLAAGWSTDGGAASGLFKRIETARRRSLKDLEKFQGVGLRNAFTGELRRLSDIYDELPELERLTSEYRVPDLNLDLDAIELPRVNPLVRDVDPREAIQEAFQWAAERGITDRESIAFELGRRVWLNTNLERNTLLKSGREAKNLRLFKKTGRRWLDAFHEQLVDRGYTRTLTSSQSRQFLYGDAFDGQDGFGSQIYRRTYHFQLSGEVAEHYERLADVRLGRQLGYLSRDRVPEVSATDPRFRSAGTTGKLLPRQVADVRTVMNDVQSALDPVFVNSQKAILRSGSRESNLLLERGDIRQFQTLLFYEEQGMFVGSGRSIRHHAVVHEGGRTQQIGNLSFTSGEVWRPYLDAPEPVPLTKDGFDELMSWTGSLINKNANSYEQWIRTARDNLEALQDIGDLQSVIGRTSKRIPKALLERLERRHPRVVNGRSAEEITQRAVEALNNHKLLASVKDKKLAELKRAALELSRLGEATNGFYDDALNQGKVLQNRFNNFKTSINIEWDASSQGPQIIGLLLRRRGIIENTGLISDHKQRVYDTYAREIIGLVNARLGTDLDWEDLSSAMKDNIMTFAYGSGQASRMDRIVDELSSVINASQDGVLVITRQNLEAVQTDLKRYRDKLRRDARRTDNPALKDSYLLQAAEVDDYLNDVAYSFRNNIPLTMDLFSDRFLTSPGARDIVNRFTKANAGVFGINDIRQVSRIFVRALTGDLDRVAKELDLPEHLLPDALPEFSGIADYIDGNNLLVEAFLTLANRGRSVTSVPVTNGFGERIEIDATKTVAAFDTYFDADGNKVKSPKHLVREHGIVDIATAKRKASVLQIHAIDPGFPQQVRQEFPGMASVFDAMVGTPSAGKRVREITHAYNVRLYETNVLDQQIGFMLETLDDVFPQGHPLREEILESFNQTLVRVREIYGISEIDPELLALMKEIRPRYGWTF